MDDVKNKIKNILVATDFSETADFAISRAIKIAKATGANLTIIHVIQKEFFDKFLESIIPKEILQTAEEYTTILIEEKIHSLLRHKVNINYTILSKGKPIVKILQYARKNKIDLLVIGAHGKYSIRDSFVGTTAEYIAAKTQCPVLIVKNSPRKPYKKILVPVDFSKVSKKALNYSVQLFPTINKRLLHVGDHEYEELLKREEKEEQVPRNKITKIRKAILLYLNNKMKKFIKGYSKKLNKHPYHITFGYPAPTIIKEAQKRNQDLIVMGTQGHGILHYRFIGSVANWVLTEIDKDILLVPPRRNK